MGAFFTNVHIRVRDGIQSPALTTELRAFVEQRLRDEGFVPSAKGEPVDREILIAPNARWIALYDARSEDQDNTVEVWAREISEALDTDAFSVLVHDSDVLALTLFAHGKQRNRFDSRPSFSGKKPSTMTPAARAAKWAHLLAPDHDSRELAAVFAAKGVFAEDALDTLAPTIGADLGLLRTGYRYLIGDGPVPAGVIRVRTRFAKRPAWERRRTGAPHLVSQWEQYGMEPPAVDPHRVLVGALFNGSVICKNRGGAARGLRIAIDAPGDCLDLTTVEVVITKPGRLQMDRYPARLVRVDDHFVAELPDVELQPGFAGGMEDLEGASMDAMMDANHAGQIHLNILGQARSPGSVTLAVELVPLEEPKGRHVEHVSVEVSAPRGVPLRAAGEELHPEFLDRLVNNTHSYLLILLDEPAERVKEHALELLAALKSAWPKGHWHVFASDERFEVGDELTLRGDLNNAKVWTDLQRTVRKMKGRITASTAPKASYDTDEASGFEVNVLEELGAIGIWLAKDRVDQDAVEPVLIRAVDKLAKTGTLIQGLLARWQIGGGSVNTPYEDVVGIHGEHMTQRAWATKWIRAIGPGQLWLGSELRKRAPALREVVELGPAIRIPVTDVAATEAHLAPLLPSGDDSHAFQRSTDEG